MLNITEIPAFAQQQVRATAVAQGIVRVRTATKSQLELLAIRAIEAAGLPQADEEYEFCPGRQFRFDLAWPGEKIAVEVQGGTWNQGRHVRGDGYESDCHKLAAAQVLGWTVLNVTGKMIRTGVMVAALRGVMGVTTPQDTLNAMWPERKRRPNRREHAERKATVLAAVTTAATSGEIAARLGMDPQWTAITLRKLARDGKLQTRGISKGMIYLPVSS